MRKVVRVTVHYIGASWRELKEWTEIVSIPLDASPDKLATRCERNMQRHGYETRGVTYQVMQSTDLVSALVESAR